MRVAWFLLLPVLLAGGEPPASSAPPPALAPTVLVCTWVGGSGDQWIQEVGFAGDGSIVAKGGVEGGKGKGFAVGYSADGAKCLGIVGDANVPSSGQKGDRWANSGTTVSDPATSSTLTIGYKQVAGLLQQPYLTSSLGWKWWGWTEAQAGSLRADSRGVRLHVMPGGRFLAKCWTDGGNSILIKDPRDLAKPNPATQATTIKKDAGGSASILIVGDARTGEPLHGTFMKHRPQAEGFDTWGRIYIAQMTPTGKDAWMLGGGGFCILDRDLMRAELNASVGCDQLLCLAVQGNLLVLGGVIGESTTVSAGALKVKNPAQPKPGGGADGFLMVIKLW